MAVSLTRPIAQTSLSPLHNSLFVFRAGLRPAALTTPLPPHSIRPAATDAASAARRRAVTVVNDTGRVPWQELSTGEKAARTTQQTFNLGILLVGILGTGGVATVLWLEVFSSDSKTAVFNRAADRVRGDPKCRELLAGEGLHSKRDIKAYGEPSWSRWARNRTIASRVETDKMGTEHLHMHFYVEGEQAKGTVTLHMIRPSGEKEFEYWMLALDVPGKQRYYLEDRSSKGDQRKHGRMFGVRWN
ncbi:TIM21-domain-containing protein [Neohortaea acidophila]|uniref:Mitochondrial import inner membrane translocase subunit Tim21 n=1 Tax=Neohortaea acidophila TaxID=245834 RepID=A0A6A6PYR1_9PEZI|nr:TIM21-domain-containing protein [Neohortaea acidophila]KAF2484891.1 TIM21-domain-containing protein [Neohortaea acidophila]